MSYGPCQFPTLGFCIERAERIKKFKPEQFWYIDTFIGDGEDTVIKYNLKWKRKRMFNKPACEAIHQLISPVKVAIVTGTFHSVLIYPFRYFKNTRKVE